jgi:kynurenine 3-monooxygenase
MLKKATIVGSGLVGTLWAIFLGRRGYQIELFERRSDMRKAGYVGGKSINLAMSHRGWTALKKAGIADQLKSVALPMYGRMMHDKAGNLTYQKYGKDNEAIWSVSRGGLNLALLKLAGEMPNIDIKFDYVCEQYEINSNELTFSYQGKQIKTNSDLIFGTDGAFSAIRYGIMKQPMFNYSQTYLEHGYKELNIEANLDGSFKLATEVLHIWPRGNFMIIALPNPEGNFTCTLFLPFKGDVSFEKLNTDAQIIDFFETYFKDIIPLMPDYLEQFHKNPTSTLITVRTDPWHYENTLVIGDAAHAIVPFYGQGMNCGFEDCTILDQLADEYQENWGTVFQKMSENRIQDANAIATLALRNFVEMRDLVGDPKFLLRKKISAWLHEHFPTRFTPTYTMVSFSDTPYHLALAEELKQDEFFKEILSISDVENTWQDKISAIFDKWY